MVLKVVFSITIGCSLIGMNRFKYYSLKMCFIIVRVCLLLFTLDPIARCRNNVQGHNSWELSRSPIFVYNKVIQIVNFAVANFGQEWEVSTVKTKAPYRAGIEHEINVTIGVKIGFRSVNITLQGISLWKRYNWRYQ